MRTIHSSTSAPFTRLAAIRLRQDLRRFGRNSASLGTDPIRGGARIAAIRAALELESLWKTTSRREGPIDVIDMFSGCGGMSAGFVAANALIPAYRLALAIDISQDANESYSRNLGIPPQHADVSALAADTRALDRLISRSRRRKGHPLVLIGCAPCQGFSSHRNVSGMADGRNNLFVTFAQIAAHLQPDAIVIENVPELLTDKYWKYLEKAKQLLARAGYNLHVGVHNMAEFGIPQERFRALLLAMRAPFAPPRGFVDRSDYRTVRQAIGCLPAVLPGEVHPRDPMHYTAGHRSSTVATIRAVPKDGGSRPYNVGPDCLRRAELRSGRAAYEDVYGRLAWDRPAITITAHARNPASGRYVHPAQDRGLSVREAALLQGFPSSYDFCGSLDERFRQIGNAVPPAFAAFLATHVLGELLAPSLREPSHSGIDSPVGLSFARLIPAMKAGHRALADLPLRVR